MDRAKGEPSGWSGHFPSYLAINLAYQLDNSEFVIRLFSTFEGLLGIVLIYQLGRHLFDHVVGTVSAILLSVSSFHILFAQRASYYALYQVLSLLSMYLLYRGLSTNNVWHWAAFTAVFVLNIQNHIAATLLLLAECCFVLIWHLTKQGGWGNAIPISKRLFIVVGCAALVGLALYGLETGVAHKFVNKVFPGFREPVYFSWRQLGSPQFWLEHLTVYRDLSYCILLVPFFAAGLIGKPNRSLMLLLICMLVPFVILAAIGVRQRYFRLRFFIYAFDVYLLIVAKGIILVQHGLQRVLTSLRVGRFIMSHALPTALVVLAVSLNLPSLRSYYRSHYDLREAATYLKTEAGPDDWIAVLPSQEGIQWLSLYANGLVDSGRVAYLYSESAVRNLVDQKPKGAKVWWVVVSHQPILMLLSQDEWLGVEFRGVSILHRANNAPPQSILGEASQVLEVVKDRLDRWLLVYETRAAWAQTYVALGTVHLLQEDMESAASAYRRAVEMNYTEALSSLGWAQYHQGSYRQAMQSFRQALGFKEKASVLAGAGAAARELGDYDSEVQYFERWIKLAPDSYEARLSLGWAYFHIQQYEKAIGAFEEAIKLNPALANAYMGKGVCYERLDNCKLAIESFEVALALNPDNSSAQEGLQRCQQRE